MTTKLYQHDVYLQHWDARVLSVISRSNSEQADLILDRTAFFPEGGGQSCDVGTIGPWKVIDVQERDGEIIHTVNLGKDALRPAEGEHWPCAIDWPRRFDNMQRHCGEHILSGILYARCGGVNRGFHMGEDYMTIDISLEDDPTDPDTVRPEQIDMALAMECERRANQVIWSDEKVTVFRFDKRDEVKDIPLRKVLAFDEDISIVCVGSPENASDCVACCGTHPSSAGQVGLIKIYKVENYKGMFRIYFEAGARALADYDHKHALLNDLAAGHSCSINDLPGKIRGLEERISSVRDELYHLKKALIRNERAGLDAALASSPEPAVIWTLEDLPLDDVFGMAKAYMGKVPRLLLLYAKKDTSFILASDGSIKCGSLVREYASFYSGKGGGNDVSARVIFSDEENALLFADLIQKHLR